MKDLTKYTCYRCAYFNDCGDATRLMETHPCEGKRFVLPTETQCRNFFKDLKGSFGNITGCGFDTETISNRMGMPIKETEIFLRETVQYKDIPLDRNCGLWSW